MNESKCVLIGFEVKSGRIDRPGQEPFVYDNREITFISNTGNTSKRVGFFPFMEKFKLEEVADILGVQPDDRLVNDALFNMVNKPVTVDYAPVKGELKVTNFRLVQK